MIQKYKIVFWIAGGITALIAVLAMAESNGVVPEGTDPFNFTFPTSNNTIDLLIGLGVAFLPWIASKA